MHSDPKPKPWVVLKTPNPNLGDAFRPQTQTLGTRLDPKAWRCTQTPKPEDALGPQTPEAHSDPKPKPWRCTWTPNPGVALRPQTLGSHLDPKPWRCTQTPNPGLHLRPPTLGMHSDPQPTPQHSRSQIRNPGAVGLPVVPFPIHRGPGVPHCPVGLGFVPAPHSCGSAEEGFMFGRRSSGIWCQQEKSELSGWAASCFIMITAGSWIWMFESKDGF